MALLSVNGLEKDFGADCIFAGVGFEVQAGDRIGLVGANGSGKTTLFKTLTGEYTPDAGGMARGPGLVLGYMEQHVCKDLERRAVDEVLTVFAPLLQMERELEDLNRAIAQDPTDARIERQAALNETYLNQGGLTCRARSRSALLGLGFTDAQMQQPVRVLSGGQRAKLQLAKLLLSGANLLLLDEPTNHLDIQSVEWLEDFLKNWKGAFFVISHDRYFLDRLCGRIFEMENHHLYTYKGNYTAFQAQKALKELSVEREYEKTSKEIKRLEAVVAQQRQWNKEKNIKTAESKEKVIARLKAGLVAPEAKQAELHFHFPVQQRSGNEVLQAEDLALAFNGQTLFQRVNLDIRRGQRVFLLGPNGCGKTSLFKTLLGQYEAAAGRLRFGANVAYGYYDQLQTGLHTDKRVIDEIWDVYPRMTETEVRSALAMFLFTGDDVFKAVAALSGGERARVLLLRLMLSRANFLLLDEPTNHLDIQSSEALETALQSYEGTLFIVSHDRYLINKLADRLYWLTPEGTVAYEGSYDNFLAARNGEPPVQVKPAAQPADAPSSPAQSQAAAYKSNKAAQAVLRKKRADLRKLEDRIDELDAEIAELTEKLNDPAVSGDYEQLQIVTEELEFARGESEGLMNNWEALSKELQALS